MGNCFIYGQSGGGNGVKTGDYSQTFTGRIVSQTIMTGYTSIFTIPSITYNNILICIREGNGIFSSNEGAIFKIKTGETATVITSTGVSISAYANQIGTSTYIQLMSSQMFNAGSITTIAWN